MVLEWLRRNLIKDFYADIGVRSAFEKRSNSVEAEVEADTSLLLLNLADMIACREKGAEAVNDMFGTSISVDLNPKYKTEKKSNENMEGDNTNEQ